MTSISSSTSMPSMIDSKINRAASAGTISSTDQTALESALSNIQTSLSSSSSTDSSSGTDMKSRIDSLIQGQVSAGTLTSDQATELQGIFAKGVHGHHGGHGGGGAIAALLGSSDTSSTTAATDDPGITTGSTDAIASLGTTSTTAAPGDGATASSTQTSEQKELDTLIGFLQTLRSSLTSGTYGASTTGSSANMGLLINAAA